MRFVPRLLQSRSSMRRKLFGYMLLLAMLLLLALTVGLFLFERFDSPEKRTFESLDIQMEVFEKDVKTHFDGLAAASLRLASDMSTVMDDYLAMREIDFEALNDAEADIAAVQERLIEPLRHNLLQENCSGVFVLWDATVNRRVADAEQSRMGLYLQQNGYKSVDDSILLYRGLTEVGKKHGVMPHRKWRLEFQTDRIPQFEALCALAQQPAEKRYCLTERFVLPGTSETAVWMVSPMVGSNGKLYGICGYEVSASYFAAYHAQPTKIAHLTCLLTESKTAILDAEGSMSCGVAGGYYRIPTGQLEITAAGNGLSFFSGDTLSYIGMTREVELSPGERHTLAVMMPRIDYDRVITKADLQNLVLWALLIFFAVSCCHYFSRHFLGPILKGLEEIKSEKRDALQSSVPEINDLFVFLAEQDRRYEASLDALAQERRTVQTEKEVLQSQYAHAQAVYLRAEAEYAKAQEELAEARQELERLAYSRKKEIDPDDYQNFLLGMQTLTKTEREVFDWYLRGYSAKEIIALKGIKESTLKFHNHNIFNKLGVSSRKQMLRYAALMQQERGETEAAQPEKI